MGRSDDLDSGLQFAASDFATRRDELRSRARVLEGLEAELASFHKRLTELFGTKVGKDRGDSHGSILADNARVSGSHGAQRDVQEGWGFLDDDNLRGGRQSHRGRSLDQALKDIYREAAWRAHPDRTHGDLRRAATQLMAEVNVAYSKGDRNKLLELLDQISALPRERGRNASIPSASGEDAGIAIDAEMLRIDSRIAYLRSSAAYGLMRRFEDVERVGRDPFRDLSLTLGAVMGISNSRSTVAADDGAASCADYALGTRDLAQDSPDALASGTKLVRYWMGDRCDSSEKGLLVRSRSLAVIANVLDHMKLAFHYEHPIVGTIAPGVVRPDFVFFDRNKKAIVLEHYDDIQGAAALELMESRRRWFESNGFAAGLGYFLIRSKVEGRPDLEHLRKVAEFISSRTG